MTGIDPNELFIGHQLDADGPQTIDPSDLTTHGVIVGMTGSGKTGLGIDLLEDALLQGVPCLVIDPKGDMGNLLLTFPELRPADFRPWIEEAAADREGITPEQLAEQTAQTWRDGLARSGISPERIARLRAAAGFTIYTPGSSAGVPLNLIGSLKAPDSADDVEALRDEVEGFTSSLLGLIGVPADPLASPEHILIANLVERSWSEGRDLDLATLLGQIQSPPMRKLGVLDLDTFYPPKDRAVLALKLNGLLASPSFASWNQGQALDIEALLHADGRPQAAIVSVSHLSEAERMFVVTMILSKMVTWTRRQSGTGELRALIYMDEVFGYVPPTAAPPAKKPILTILKQARAHGVGMVLSTQNPVDVDYKAISNAGTWMIGRLQTERDKARLLEGMTSAAGGVDKSAIDATISGLDKRQFLLHSTRADAPVRFSTRWAMSYLAGPLTRDQIKQLSGDRPSANAAGAAIDRAAGAGETAAPELADDETLIAPEVADGTDVYYLDAATPWAAEVGAVPAGTRLAPALMTRVQMLFDDTKADLRETVEWEAFVPVGARDVVWAEAITVDYDTRDLRQDAPAGAAYVLSDAPLKNKTWFRSVTADLKNHLHRSQSVTLQANRELKLYSRIDESEAAFKERCHAAADEGKDEEVAKIRERLAARMDKLEVAIAKYGDRIEELQADVRNRRNQDLISIGSSVLGSILGGRSSTTTIARSAGRAATRSQSSSQRIRTIEHRIEEKNLALEDLEEDLLEAVVEIDEEWNEKAEAIEPLEISLEKSDISVDEVSLLWLPVG
jgi:DNA helicase HerA-like ATPase